MKTPNTNATITSLSLSSSHSFSKQIIDSFRLIEGIGVENDAHAGITVKHRSRVAIDPTQPNLRQVHLIHSELHDELQQSGFEVKAGDMGENITTKGIDLLGLPRGTVLAIGNDVRLQVTGLRNPCNQLDDFQDGLMSAVLDRDDAGNLIRKAGIMTVVLTGGSVFVGDSIEIELPGEPFMGLERV